MTPRKARPATSPRAVWDALRQSGASAVQAAGIMGNWISESGLNPEANAVDSNGRRSYGLAQWNTAHYPNAATLVTGNTEQDIAAQVLFFAHTGGFKAAAGSTPQQVASNVATRYERCKTCGPGGASNTERQAQAATVAGWAASGAWPATSSGATDTAQLGAAGQAQATATCWWSLGTVSNPIPSWVPFIGGGSTSYCVMAKSQARGVEAVLVMLTGGLILLTGLGLILSATQSGKLLPLAEKVATVFPAVP